jgi:hypothetical protein
MKADKTRKTVSQSVPVSVFNQVSVVGVADLNLRLPSPRTR